MTGQPRSRRRIWSRALSAPVTLVALVATATAIPGSAAVAATGAANPVLTWDRNAQTAIWDVAAQQPNEQVRSFAMVNGAVYDAVNAIAGAPYEPYLVAPTARGTESVDAAVATAAHGVLAALFPAQRERLRTQYDEALAAVPDGRAKQGGVRVGAHAAAAMVAARQDDGAFGDQQWRSGTAPGQWRPTPPLFLSQGAWTGHMRPFLLPHASLFRAPGPPALTSRTYTDDFHEVKELGSATSGTRTPDQTEAALWWHDRRSANWEIKRQLATTQHLDTLRTARFFAMTDLVVADSGVACFREKDVWSYWRPVTAIAQADADGNPATTADPTWTPLLVTPPFPEYPSGHACGTGARMSLYRHFFGRDDVSFSGSSADSGTTRRFDSFSQALTELIGARVWGGVHFRTADVDGARLGEAVSRYAVRHHFRPRR
ncbi:vanadium-dependent haloperoxidase [Micromonospora krabiensis]|uniref:PAP2 superfamily protein n=1 Tax=Micromonospora krabiensis TaxID=307121 RepID=A0A1C3MZN1_9ACTN|nr:vanadium-dependent haloperoxidase [Micromonospora krabiensis]SBV25779.1 PAP2 superfamily protein [Micromonospora krabiensis]